MSFQQARFNFGREPFKFPPNGLCFQTFNESGRLEEEDKLILPKQIRLLQLHSLSLKEDSCTLCFDGSSSIELLPCLHMGFCHKCSLQLVNCPLCRCEIKERRTITAPNVSQEEDMESDHNVHSVQLHDLPDIS